MRGLLEDDGHWNDALTESEGSRSRSQIRNLFAVMLHFCAVGDPIDLWTDHK